MSKKQLRIIEYVTIAVCVALIVAMCAGCGFALISKADIDTFHGDFKTYRNYVAPTEEPEKVNQLGDNLEKVLKGWKGESDAK